MYVLKAILWMAICVVLLNLEIVLELPLEHLGMEVTAYAHHSILIEEQVNANIICGAAIINVIMEKTVILALKIVNHLVNQLDLFVAIKCVVLEKIAHPVLLIVVNVEIVEMDPVKILLVKLVAIALKIVEPVLFHDVAMVIVIFTLMKTVLPVLKIVAFAL